MKLSTTEGKQASQMNMKGPKDWRPGQEWETQKRPLEQLG